MSKRTTGERIAKAVGLRAFNNGCYFPQVVEAMVDAAIRRAQAKAWEEGKIRGMDLMAEDSDGIAINPYRGRAKR